MGIKINTACFGFFIACQNLVAPEGLDTPFLFICALRVSECVFGCDIYLSTATKQYNVLREKSIKFHMFRK